MKKFVLGVNLFINSFVFSQVGIGTTNPGATLEINNSNNDAVILKLKGNDNQKQKAEYYKDELEKSGAYRAPIVTEIKLISL